MHSRALIKGLRSLSLKPTSLHVDVFGVQIVNVVKYLVPISLKMGNIGH